MIKKINKKHIIIVLSIILSFSFIISCISFIKNTSKKENLFLLGTVKPEIIETFDSESNIKKDVYIKNSGNSPIYVRVAVTYIFEDNSGYILENKPVKDVDYSIIFSDSNNWFLNEDGFYYYKKAIKSSESTEKLIDEFKSLSKNNDKKIIVDIMVQAHQAFPSRAVSEAWSVNVINDELTLE